MERGSEDPEQPVYGQPHTRVPSNAHHRSRRPVRFHLHEPMLGRVYRGGLPAHCQCGHGTGRGNAGSGPGQRVSAGRRLPDRAAQWRKRGLAHHPPADAGGAADENGAGRDGQGRARSAGPARVPGRQGEHVQRGQGRSHDAVQQPCPEFFPRLPGETVPAWRRDAGNHRVPAESCKEAGRGQAVRA